jgi:hypothetical protein
MDGYEDADEIRGEGLGGEGSNGEGGQEPRASLNAGLSHGRGLVR